MSVNFSPVPNQPAVVARPAFSGVKPSAPSVLPTLQNDTVQFSGNKLEELSKYRVKISNRKMAAVSAVGISLLTLNSLSVLDLGSIESLVGAFSGVLTVHSLEIVAPKAEETGTDEPTSETLDEKSSETDVDEAGEEVDDEVALSEEVEVVRRTDGSPEVVEVLNRAESDGSQDDGLIDDTVPQRKGFLDRFRKGTGTKTEQGPSISAGPGETGNPRL